MLFNKKNFTILKSGVKQEILIFKKQPSGNIASTALENIKNSKCSLK